uniref:Uncharacterized protein n=1 Tax=Anopheles minimus TaxID=112268 RepID=A0A182WIG0_9DIPT
MALGDMSGDCMAIPEMSKKGLFYFLLIPFSLPVWILCGILIVIAFVLNWMLPQLFPNTLLLTILFGDQVPDQRYTNTERRLLVVGNVLLFFLTEAYWVKLHALFIESLNAPHLRTLDQFLQTDIPLEVTREGALEYYRDLHAHRQLVVSDS